MYAEQEHLELAIRNWISEYPLCKKGKDICKNFGRKELDGDGSRPDGDKYQIVIVCGVAENSSKVDADNCGIRVALYPIITPEECERTAKAVLLPSKKN